MRVIGMGLSSRASPAEVAAALVAAGPVAALALPETRKDHPALAGVTLPMLAQSLADLRGIPTLTQSPRILREYGCGSLAEAAAIHASGGNLVSPRRICGGVTWALAEGPGHSLNRKAEK
ncbi:MAG: cobalamin biosynthesis protein [Pseudorhodobacter sp.]